MQIPPYPELRPLQLADKPLLDELLEQLQPRISEFTFAGLYLFRSAHHYRLTRVADSVVVIGRGYQGDDYFLPPLCGEVAASAGELFRAGLTLYGADADFCARYLTAPELEVVEERASADYLYLRQELAELAGHRFHKKKNRINHFVAHYPHTVAPYHDRDRCACLRLLKAWLAAHDPATASASFLPEAAAAREALLLASLLDLEGVVIRVDGTIAAFALGERLNRTTAVCHFEKAAPHYDGLAQLVDREFNRLLFTDCTYVNREQDLGEVGLRVAKSSYHPVELVRKFRARQR